MPTTAPWTWTPRDRDPVDFELTADHVSAIRDRVVWWDDTEAGAPGLAHPDLVPLGGRPQTELETAVEVFLSNATLPSWAGPVHSPWGALPADEVEDMLATLPDAALRDRWRQGGALDLTPSAEARALWAEAGFRSCGIDPKRPLGTANLERDLRRLLDPDEHLDDEALAALGDRARAELLPMLQRFVQHATIPLGPYNRADGTWTPGAAPTEAIDADEWWWRVCGEAATMNTGYSATVRALHHLVDEGRITGDYAELAQRFTLHDHYGAAQHLKWTGGWTERLQAAAKAFPEQRVFRLNLARQANARADFAAARDHLMAMERWTPPLPGLSLASPGWPAVVLLEGLACRRGLGLFDADAFLHALTDRSHDADATPWEVVYRVLHKGRDLFDDAVLWRHAEAVSAQIQLMERARPRSDDP